MLNSNFKVKFVCDGQRLNNLFPAKLNQRQTGNCYFSFRLWVQQFLPLLICSADSCPDAYIIKYSSSRNAIRNVHSSGFPCQISITYFICYINISTFYDKRSKKKQQKVYKRRIMLRDVGHKDLVLSLAVHFHLMMTNKYQGNTKVSLYNNMKNYGR